MSDALGFKKSKGRRNIRQRGSAGLDDAGAAEIVKRAVRAPAGARVEYVSGGVAAAKKEADSVAPESVEAGAAAADTQSAGEALDPFGGGGGELPTAQDVYEARRQRRQQQAVLAARARGADDDDEGDYENVVDGGFSGADFIGLDLSGASSGASGDEGPLAVGRAERQAEQAASRRTMAQQVERAQSDGESSDWERAQLRSAGVAVDTGKQRDKHRRAAAAEEDEGEWRFDAEFVRLVIDEEMRQEAEERERLRVAEARLARAAAAVERADAGIAEAQRQLAHFTALAKTIAQANEPTQ
ncbi:hypothetical protein LPJ53_002757 [Coemansia erecta]|uniref:Uncharacterized protein n=1 Tax=Coemansia erecta TaxID=147472 RepID=A0A9W7Y1M4_9FUNG|nr:hypothetical protein LPJ53_002757 [Coemansia erecta]